MGNIRESLRRPGIIPLDFNEIPMAVNFSGKYSPDPTETGEGNRSFDLKKIGAKAPKRKKENAEKY
jgi:hypothetical protein